MQLSQFGTRCCVLAIALMLSASHIALAAKPLKIERENIEFRDRLRTLYADKNRPFPKSLTYKLPEGIPTNKVPQIPPSKQKSIFMGGVSDGGGNAVGLTFFDFYENEGSLEISIDELIALEPLAEQMLRFLNQEVPAINYLSSGAFGDIIKKSLGFKKIYLESKPISSAACLNQSMVSTKEQKVAACQSNTELRVNARWLLETDARNRAGLVTHEMILAWARVQDRESDKNTLEEKVRKLTRDSFEPGVDIAASIRRIFAVKAFSRGYFTQMLALPTKVFRAKMAFCENPMDGAVEDFSAYQNDSFLRKELPESVGLMENASQALQRGEPIESYGKVISSICEDYFIDKMPIHEPNMDNLPEGCIRHLDEASEKLVRRLTKKVEGLSRNEEKWLLSATLITVKSSANLCSGLRGLQLEKRLFMTEEKGKRMMDETYSEAINYVRWRLKQQNLAVSFMSEVGDE